MRPSSMGIDYLTPIFRNAISATDLEIARSDLFQSSRLVQPYHSVNIDVSKRIRFL